MVATVIVGMLCVHLLCFAVMFWLISTRLQGGKLGMDAFAIGNAMLGVVYVMQLLGAVPSFGVLNVANHTLTLCVPVVYWIGAMRFFGRSAPLIKPLFSMALLYTLAQVIVEALWGLEARYAMLSLFSASIFAAMTGAVVYVMRTFARDLRAEMALFALLIGGLCVLNFIKCALILRDGLGALSMGLPFQVIFYGYMSLLATVLAPSMIWLVLRRLTDALRASANRDPLTQLLNRRGLRAELESHFRVRGAGPARLLMLDIDHFKRINDSHGHQAGDLVLCQVADLMRSLTRRGDLVSRTGGEEFAIVCLNADEEGVRRLADRLRAAIEHQTVAVPDTKASLRCTVTIGISLAFDAVEGFDAAMQQADAALYRGKATGRNRIEWGVARPDQDHAAPTIPGGI